MNFLDFIYKYTHTQVIKWKSETPFQTAKNIMKMTIVQCICTLQHPFETHYIMNRTQNSSNMKIEQIYCHRLKKVT